MTYVQLVWEEADVPCMRLAEPSPLTLKLYPGSSRAPSPLQELLQTQSFKKQISLILPQRSFQPLSRILTNTANMSEENIYDEIEIEVRSLHLLSQSTFC